jgi:hypothetical protein
LPHYKLSELAPPRLTDPRPLAAESTWAHALDDHGNAVGGAFFPPPAIGIHAVAWEGGTPTILETSSPSRMSFGYGVDEVDHALYAVGIFPVEEPRHAFLYRNGQLEDLDPRIGRSSSWASGVNGSGAVVGTAGWNRPFIYDSGANGVTFLDPLPGHAMAFASAINSSGHVTGISKNADWVDSRVFLYANGQVTDQGPASWATEINNGDTIVGSKAFEGAQAWTAYRLKPGAGFENLGHTSKPGYGGSHGNGINDHDVVVGHSFSGWSQAQQEPFRAFVHFPQGTPDAGWWDLQDVTEGAEGWVLESAGDINNAGQIVGSGRYLGQQRAFMLRPERPFDLFEYTLQFLLLLGGVEVGGGGIGILPGGKGVPIDPHGWERLSRAERDMQLGLAVRKLATLLEDQRSQEMLEQTAAEIIQSAINKLERGT